MAEGGGRFRHEGERLGSPPLQWQSRRASGRAEAREVAVTVAELIEKLRALPEALPVEMYPGDEVINVVHVQEDRVLLMERPFDEGDPTTLWREFFTAGRKG